MEYVPNRAPDEFVRLLLEHQQALRVYIRALMPGREEAWDVFQQANAVLWSKQATFTVGTNFRAWAFSVARFEVNAFFQKERRKGWLIFDDELLDLLEDELPSEPSELESRYRALETCVTGLKPHDRELVRQRYILEGSLETYAQQLGRSVGTLKTRLFRLREALRNCMLQQLTGEGI
jgi:RNA polymerase sigma-70 factor (ECF subfamily)